MGEMKEIDGVRVEGLPVSCEVKVGTRVAPKERVSGERVVPLEDLPLGYQSLDENGCILDVNEAWLEILGYLRSNVIGRWFGEFLVPGSADHFRENFPKFRSAGKVNDVEFDMLRSDGTTVSVSFNGRIERDAGGDFVRTHCIMRDVTESRRAVQALCDSEERFRNIVDLSETGYFFIDTNGFFRYVNDAWLRMHGYSTRRELFGRHFADGQAEPVRSEILSAIPRILHGEPLRSWETARLRNDGTVRHLILSCNRVSKKGEVIGIEGFALDITDIKHAREDLSRMLSINEKLRVLLVSLNSCRKLSEAFPMILGHAIDICELDGGAVYMVEDDIAVMKCRQGLGDEFIRAVERIPLSSPPAIAVMESAEAIDLAGVFMDRHRLYSEFGLKHGYSTALRIGGKVIGFLNLGSSRDDISTQITRQTLSLIGHEMESVLERLQTEERLRRSEEKFRTVADFTYDWEYWIGNDGRLEYISPSCERITGYAAEEFMRCPDLMTKIVHPDDLMRIKRHQEGVTDKDDVQLFEFRITTRTGEARWISHSCRPVYDDEGNLSGRRGSNRDITGRKEAELQLAENQRRLAALLSNLQGAAYSYRLGDTPSIEFVSDGCYELTGLRPAELIESDMMRFAGPVHPDDLEYVISEVRAALCQDRAFRLQHRIVTADGRVKWVMHQGRGNRSSTGGILRVEGFAHDITDRVDMETELRDSELKFKAIFNSSVRARILLDRDMVARASNELARYVINTVTGKELQIGESITDLVPQFLEGSFRVNFDQAVLGERTVVERRVSGLDAEPRYYTIEYTPVYQDRGDVIGVCMSISDITSVRKADTERRILEERIRHAQKLESLGVLAGGIAHDFNNLLMGILGNVELATACSNGQSELDECLREIATASHRAVELTSQMLAYAGRGVMIPEPTNLSEFMTGIADVLKSAAGKHTLRLDLSAGLPPVEIDRTQIEQVIINLVTNSAEAIGDEMGQIRLRTDTAELDEASQCRLNLAESVVPGRYVVLEAYDDGSGMDKATLSRIFEPFFSTKFTGRGLGLAAVLGIVRIHKGTIDVVSNPGAGTSVKVFLPCHIADSVPISSKEQSAVESPSHTILVVDDEEPVRNVSRAVLARAGYSAILAASGEEGIHLLRSNRDKISAIILDMVMPGMSGSQMLRFIREIAPDMPILFASGYSDEHSFALLKEEPNTSFIQKPFGVEELTKKLKELLSARVV
jgi:PAS domain S-box-containing protein